MDSLPTTVEELVEALNVVFHRAESFRIVNQYDFCPEEMLVLLGVGVNSHHEGEAYIGLDDSRLPALTILQELVARFQLVILDPVNANTLLAAAGFVLHEFGGNHAVEAQFDLPDDCDEYTCEIRQKEV